MKTLPFVLSLLACLPLSAAAPDDATLLDWVKQRSKLERVTPTPFDMEIRTATFCQAPQPVAQGPHEGANAHVFVNEAAVLPVFDPLGKFPEGSLLLKEKLGRKDGATQLFTGMLKREKGYFPEAGDWEFFAVDAAAAKVVERGKLQRCATCHEDYAKGDYITRAYIQPAQLSGGRVVLHAKFAQVQGSKLHYEPQPEKNTLGYWTEVGDKASWHFQLARPGTYEVHVWQGCGKDSGGSEVEIACGGDSVRFTVEDTGHFQNFKERNIGKLTFNKAGPLELEVRPIAKPGLAVMDLRQIVLVPVP